jgi:hypothetical protein
MRYIKKYQIFESLSTEDIREDLTEICYELTDGRFAIKIYDNNELTYIKVKGENPFLVDDKILFIGLSNYMDFDGFSFDEVKEVVLRVIDYLGSRYKGCSVLPVGQVGQVGQVDRLGITGHLRSNVSSDIYELGNFINLIIIYK